MMWFGKDTGQQDRKLQWFRHVRRKTGQSARVGGRNRVTKKVTSWKTKENMERSSATRPGSVGCRERITTDQARWRRIIASLISILEDGP